MDKRAFAMIVCFIMLLSCMPAITSGQLVSSVEVKIVGENRRQSQGVDVMVGGALHNMTLRLTAPSSDIDILMYSDSAFTTANQTNTYRWTYDGEWNDTLYDAYVNNSRSTIYPGNVVCVFLGVANNITRGSWTLSIKVNGVEEWNETLRLEIGWTGIAASCLTFYFDIVPYLTGFKSSWNPDDPDNTTSLRLTNGGNLPVDLSFSYDIYDNLFTTTNDTGILHLGDVRYHYISFQAQSWSPRKFTVKGQVFASASAETLVTDSMISFINQASAIFTVIVTVARPGYDIFQMDGLVVQFKERIIADYYDTVNLDLYLTGYKDSYISAAFDNLTLVNTMLDGLNVTQPVLVHVVNDTEAQIIVTINCSKSPPVGQQSILTSVTYTAETFDQQTNGQFVTTVVVKAKSYPSTDGWIGIGPLNIYAIIIIMGIVIGVVWLMLNQRKKQFEEKIKREVERKETKERRPSKAKRGRK